jgi:hypothetical protein
MNMESKSFTSNVSLEDIIRSLDRCISSTNISNTPGSPSTVAFLECSLLRAAFNSISCLNKSGTLPPLLLPFVVQAAELSETLGYLEDLLDPDLGKDDSQVPTLVEGVRSFRISVTDAIGQVGGYRKHSIRFGSLSNRQYSLANNIFNRPPTDIEKCMSLLGDDEDGKIQENLGGRAIAKTGLWFTDSKEFSTWVTEPGQTLFCPGIPGAGKTLITSVAIAYVRQRFSNDPAIGVAFLYSGESNSTQLCKDGVIHRLLRPFVERGKGLPAARAVLEKLMDGTAPSSEELLEALRQVLGRYDRAYIFIDSLHVVSSPSEIVEAFSSLQCALGKPNLFYTSRPVPSVEKLFQRVPTLKIEPTKEDIACVLEAEISAMTDAIRPDEKLMSAMRDMVMDDTDGMWVFPLPTIFII